MEVSNLFGIGYTPLMPGTAACVLALLAFIAIKSTPLFLIFTLFSTVAAFKYSTRAEELFAEKDSKKIVVDDFCGMLITYLFIPHDVRFIVCGFFLFRMLDMLKIPPADSLEKLHGAKGIVGDDLVAGIYANVLLHLVRILLVR